MSKIVKTILEVVDNLYDDETAQEAAEDMWQRMLEASYYREVNLVSFHEEDLPDED